MKRFLAIVMSLALSLTAVIPASARGPLSDTTTITINDQRISLNSHDLEDLTDSQLKQVIIDIGLSPEQADELIAAKNMVLSSPATTGMARASRFPSNPHIGDVFWDTIYLSFREIDVAASLITELTTAGLSNIVATVVAAAVLAYMSSHSPSGTNGGVKVRIEYYYGPDNDGEVRWNYRRVMCSYY